MPDFCLPKRQVVPVIPTAIEAELLNPAGPIVPDNIMIHRVEIGTIAGIQSRLGIPTYWPSEYDQRGKQAPATCKDIVKPE